MPIPCPNSCGNKQERYARDMVIVFHQLSEFLDDGVSHRSGESSQLSYTLTSVLKFSLYFVLLIV